MNSPFTLAHGEIQPADMPTESLATSSVAVPPENPAMSGVAAVADGWGAIVRRLEEDERRRPGDWWQDQFGRLHAIADFERITKMHCPHFRVTALKHPNSASQQRAD